MLRWHASSVVGVRRPLQAFAFFAFAATQAAGQEAVDDSVGGPPAIDYEITESTRGISIGIAESSWIHQPQIQEIVQTPAPRVIPITKLPLDPEERKRFRPAPRKFASFDGISHTGWVPPDCTLAVGPNHVVETVNMTLAWYDKAGVLQFSNDLGSAGNPGFFEGLGAGSFTFDPKCFYDSIAGRFVVVCFEVYGSTESWIDIAVSDDSDPNGTWYKYRMDAVTWVGSTSYWVDYPGCGYDDKAYVITGNLFGLNAGGWGGVKYRAIDKNSILSGGTAVFWDLRDGNAASVQVGEHHTNPIGTYMVSTDSSTTLKMQALKNVVSAPTLVTKTVTVNSYSPPPQPPELGGGAIDALDGRIINAEFGNGKFVTGHGVNTGDGRCLARWYVVKTNNWPTSGSPTIEQQGNIDLGAGIHTFYPGVARQSSGEIGMIVGYSSVNEYAGLAVAVHRTTDVNGTVGLLERVKYGTGSASGRWGDYFDACIDPSDATKFWGVGEYPNWTTYIAEFDGVPTVPTTGVLYSLRAAVNLGGLRAEAGDIVHLDAVSGFQSMYLDLSDLGVVSTANVDAFCVLADGSILLSFDTALSIPGLTGGPTGTNVADEDIVKFSPTSLGELTAGTVSFYFDGTDVGCGATEEDVDALAVDALGNLWLSFEGSFTVGSISGKDEDIVQFTPTSLGATTTGSWSWVLYGLDTDVKLGQAGEDTDALDYDLLSGTLTVSTDGNFQVPNNITGQNRDLITFTPTALGFNPAGTWAFALDGDLYGLTASDIDGLEILP
jgi:hypothetical protein